MQVGRMGPLATRNLSVPYYDPSSIPYRNAEYELHLQIKFSFITVRFRINLFQGKQNMFKLISFSLLIFNK